MTALVAAFLLAVTPPGGVGETVLPPGVAVATAGAARTAPPPTTTTTPPVPGFSLEAPAGLTGCAEMRWYRQLVGLPAAFDAIGWRESNCRNEDAVHTSCCYGYWQLHRLHFDGSGYVHGEWCDARTVFDVASDTPADKLRQACAAKALYDEAGLSPWAATS